MEATDICYFEHRVIKPVLFVKNPFHSHPSILTILPMSWS